MYVLLAGYFKAQFQRISQECRDVCSERLGLDYSGPHCDLTEVTAFLNPSRWDPLALNFPHTPDTLQSLQRPETHSFTALKAGPFGTPKPAHDSPKCRLSVLLLFCCG